MYLFRSFRKPKLEHHYKILEETVELRKLMGWSGSGGITNGMLNPSGMVSHYKRFNSLDEIDKHLSSAQSNPKVGEKINQVGLNLLFPDYLRLSELILYIMIKLGLRGG